MYIKLTEDKELVITKAETIYRGENLATSLIFLIPPKFGELNTEDCTVFLSYIRADGVPDIAILKNSGVMYKESYFQFTLPVDCKLTFAAGEAIIWLQAQCDASDTTAIVKSSECSLWIEDTQDANGSCSDATYTAIYQLQSDLSDLTVALNLKADGLTYDDDTRILQLTSNGETILSEVVVPSDQFIEEEMGSEWSGMESDSSEANEYWEDM